MTFLPTISPLAFAALAAVPIGILLLYFLKLRRDPVEVPSTYLWASTIEDLHVNSLLQKLKRSLLLALQLAAIALAAMALLRPGMRGTTTSTPRRIFCLDTSASMNATDARPTTPSDDGESVAAISRFELARRRIEAEIESMRDNESAMLISFDNRAETLQPFTSDRSRLRAALATAKPTVRPTDILGALRAADGLANPRRTSQIGDTNDVQVAEAKPADLIIHSDGGFDTVTEFSLGNLIPRYVPVGSDQPSNVAITAFSASRNVEQPGRIEIFATIANMVGPEATTTATLRSGGEFLDAQSLTLATGDQTAVSFSLENEDAMQLDLTLDIDDDLVQDNTAYAALTPMRSVKVLIVTRGNTPLELGLGTSSVAGICRTEIVSPDFLKTDAYKKRAESGGDDLVIFDQCRPDLMPRSNTFFIGSLPVDQWRFTSEPSPLSIIDVDRADPLLQYMELTSLLVVEGRGIEGPPGTKELIDADVGVVMAIAPREGYRDLVLGFNLLSPSGDGGSVVNTNWYAERSWPVFLLNLLRHLAGASDASGAMSHSPGSTVEIRLASQFDQVTVRREGASKSWTFAPDEIGRIEFIDTEEPGNYSVRSGSEEDGQLLQLFSINLFDRVESQLVTKPQIEIGFEGVQGVEVAEDDRQEYWRIALLLMLGLIGAEWFLFGKRIG